jgi:regulator of protease activity HflC (stomatin/prohibitin superfamily)
VKEDAVSRQKAQRVAATSTARTDLRLSSSSSSAAPLSTSADVAGTSAHSSSSAGPVVRPISRAPPTGTPRLKEPAMVIDVSRLLFVRHMRAEPTAHVLFFKDGALRKSGPGLAFWFLPLGASVSVIPLDDRELPVLFKGRSADFQDVAVNGAVIWRVGNPEDVARRVDFSVDTHSGAYSKEPLDRIAATITQLAGQLASTFLTQTSLRVILKDGIEVIRGVIHDGLVADPCLAGMGVEIVATRVASVLPTSEMEKALQMPTREKIQQEADEATFGRRALAVDKERAIQENELSNQIELAKREEQLIAQRGQNERRRATETAESKRIEAEAGAKTVKLNAAAQAESIRLLEEAKVNAEKERMDIYRDLPSSAMMGLAARELAGKLQSIDHLTLSPDVLGSLLQRVLGGQARRLEGDAG